MRKKENIKINQEKKILSILEIFLIISSTFAFAVILNMGSASGEINKEELDKLDEEFKKSQEEYQSLALKERVYNYYTPSWLYSSGESRLSTIPIYKTQEAGITTTENKESSEAETFGNAFTLGSGNEDKNYYRKGSAGTIQQSTDNGKTWTDILNPNDKERVEDFLKDSSSKKSSGFWQFTKGLTTSDKTGFAALEDGVKAIATIQTFTQVIGIATGREDIASAIGGAFSAGVAASRLMSMLKLSAGWQQFAFIAGFVLSLIFYKEYTQETVTFECLPWQAPYGGTDCEQCNKGNEPCSLYRCESLGQACKFIEDGELCINGGKGDAAAPIIDALWSVLTIGHQYKEVKKSPPGLGMRITSDTGKDGCIKAFTPLKFGIKTDEPSKCKLDYVHRNTFDEMQFAFESTSFAYNHTQILSIPNTDALNDNVNGTPAIKNDGNYILYARCTDAMGNWNVQEFAIKFCVEKGPDTSAPIIESTSIDNNMPVRFNQSSVFLEVYLNEPSECKWSRRDESYDAMNNSFECATNVWQMNALSTYTCAGTLTGIRDRQANDFYFRCKDKPWLGNYGCDAGPNDKETQRICNQQSYKFTLIGTEPLKIQEIIPNNKTITGPIEDVDVGIEVRTINGYKNGEARCGYGLAKGSYIEFYETGGNIHKQNLTLKPGDYKYYIRCTDLGGNYDESNTSFRVVSDKATPVVVRAYNEPGQGLQIITNENSECVYSALSCDFRFEDGISMPITGSKKHTTEWKINKNYYIKCRDSYNNQPAPDTCSVIVRAYNQE